MIKECDNCGKTHDKAFVILKEGREHTFDSFECAINFVAPRCFHCNTFILGRQVDQDGETFCSIKCSKAMHFSTVMP